jgi:hypothetical protein
MTVPHLMIRRLFIAVALAASLTATAACDPSAFAPDGTSSSGTGDSGGTGAGAGQQLDTLTISNVGLTMAGYSRAKFHIWADQGHGCDTRDVVLQRDGKGVVTGSKCKIGKGAWASPYNNKTYTDPQKLDIDHLVPLGNAWKSGAKNWTDDQRKQFANDLTRPQLIAVDLTDNRAKGDQDPSQWKPPNRGFWCTYATDWVTVKAYWHLTVTALEKSALQDMLGTCP